MKKHLLFKFLLTFTLALFTVGWVNGQNLLLNGDFELWDDPSTPTSWTKVENITQESTTKHGGTYSAKHIGGTKDLGQTITVDPDTWYLITIWYYVESGDGSDARIWSFFQDAGDTRLDDIPALLGPDNGYFNSDASWQKYEATVLSPADAASLYFEVRTYSGATVYWDDISVVETTAPPASIVDVKYVSETALDVIYDMSQTSVDPADYNLTGTTAITFSGATIDGTDDKIVHLTGASASIVGDGILDNIADASANLDFYAGITPIEYINTNNPGGTITDGINATFTGIISANDGFNNVWIADAEGAYNGILIFDYDFDGNVAVGDSVLFTATRTTSFNLSQLENPVLLNNIASGKTPYGPSVIIGSQIENTISADTDPAETWEGQLVKIVNAEITADVNTGNGGGHYFYTATDDAATTSFAIGDNVDYEFGNISFTLNDDVTITGVVDFDYGKYRINPRSVSDIVSATDTVGSTEYTVAHGTPGSITDMPFSTDLATFESNIEAADSATFDVFDADGTTPATVLDDTKLLIVTAADGITKGTYSITRNAVLTDATVTSSVYTVVEGSPGSITNVPFGTDLATFESNITPPTYGSFEVYESDGTTEVTDNSLATGYILTGTAEDGTTTEDYEITVSAVIPDEDSDVTDPTTQVAAATVAVVNGDTEGEAFEVFSFDINDAGTADGLPTYVSQIVLFYGPNMTLDLNTDDLAGGWFEIDGTPVDFTGEPVVGEDSIAFQFAEGEITVPDGGNVNAILKVYLNANPSDGKIVQFMIDADQHGFETTGISSKFATTLSGDIVGNDITIDVVATELGFSTEPTDVWVDYAIDPAVVIEAVDANGNVDTDYTEDVTVSSSASTATLGGTLTVAAVSGVATFSDLTFDAAEDNVTLSVTDGTLNGGPSATFNVTVEPEKDLFFSEYIEPDGGNNKALEIYNPTGALVDLANYVIRINSNGSEWTSFMDFPVGTTIEDGDVYVITHAEADAEKLIAASDTAVVNPYSGGTCAVAIFNGNDARALCKVNGTDTTIIDIIGEESVDSAWSVAGVDYATKDHTLLRKTSITIGNTDWTASAGTNADNSEWIVKDANYFDDIGIFGLKSGTDILTYDFNGLSTGAADIDATAHTVDIEVAFGTPVTALVAEFTLSDGASAKVGSTSQVSGTTANDFSSPVTYTVTAEDASTQDWVVTVTVATTQSSEKEITSFTVDGIVGSATITSGDATVDATVEYGTDITSLKPTFEISNLATFVTDTSVAKDFTNAQDYIVEAEDGTQKTWTVAIAEEAPTDVSDIASLRALYSETNETLYRITGEVTFTYATAPYFYIQDATAAILIYDHATYGVISTAYSIGDNVQNLVGVFDTFGENMQFALVEDPGAAVSTGNTIDAQVVTIPTLAANYDDYDAELIMLEDVTFTETGTFAAGENYTLNNGSDQVAMRTNFSDADYIGEDIPTETLDVTALAGIYNGDIQVYLRSQSDMVVVTTGITNPDGIVSMNIFPNPSNGLFTLEMNTSKAGTFNVQIYNIQGQVVYNKEINQDGFYKDQIDISNEASGIYYIRINDGKNTKVSKIMIQ